MCEECVSVIFRDSVQTSLKNRTSVGYLLNLPVDIDSILINGVSPVFFPPCVFKKRAESDCCVLLQLFSAQITHQTQQVGRKCFSYEWITVLCFSDWCPPPPPIVPLSGSQCVDKMYANLPGAKVPLNIFSSWGGLSCHLKLTAVPGSLIRLTITSFLIEPTDCVNDALTVYDALLPMRGRILHR